MNCPTCNNEIPLVAERCLHCAMPGLFPNVRAAAEPNERDALDRRVKKAIQDATSRGCEHVLNDLATALAGSQAVIARPLNEIQRLASSDKQGYATYYQLTDAEVRLPDGDEWNSLRRITDEALFPGYKDKIRFAALTLDGVGLSNYGDCSITLREHMIRHRTSVFEENTALFMKRHKVSIPDVAARIQGYRATWDDRVKVCIAKLAPKLTPALQATDHPRILLNQGATSDDDEFVEAHIFGSITARTIERVVVTAAKGRKSILRALSQQLMKVGAVLETR